MKRRRMQASDWWLRFHNDTVVIFDNDDKVLITFNYKEGTQTVTFGKATEVVSKGNGSDLDCFTTPRSPQARKCPGASFLLLLF